MPKAAQTLLAERKALADECNRYKVALQWITEHDVDCIYDARAVRVHARAALGEQEDTR